MNNLPSMVRDNLVVWYEGAKKEIKRVANQIPWHNQTLAVVLLGDDEAEDDLAIEDNLPKDDEFYSLLGGCSVGGPRLSSLC